MNFFQKVMAVWQNVSLVQRALLIAIVLAFAILGVLLTQWASRPDMRVLYSNLDPEEAAKIIDKIDEKGVACKLANGGTTIRVPRENVSRLRLDMAKEGLPESGQKGYGIFDKQGIGISPFVQNVNLKRALQDELAKSIQMIDGVAHARIHIVSPKQTLFNSQGGQTSASVVLRLKAGYRLSPSNIAAITHLVAGSVEALKSESVIVVDSQGQLLSGESEQGVARGAGTVADYKERVEQHLSNKVENMLTAVLGPGRATVMVSAIIDMNSVELAKETYEPKGITQKEEIKKENETKPGPTSTEGPTASGESKKTGSTTTTEYVIPKTVQRTVELPGKIKSLSVAAFVDLSTADANGLGATGQSTQIVALTDVKAIIKKALGPRLADEDIEVKDVKFNRPTEALIGPEQAGGLDFVAIARQSSLGIMAVCAFLVLKIFSGAKKKAAAPVAAGAAQPLEIGAEGIAGAVPPEAGSSEPLAMRRQIANNLKTNPEQVRQLFTSWLEQKGG